MRRGALALILLAGCGRAPAEPAPAASAAVTAAAAATFSREAFPARAGDAGAGDPAVPATADPEALAEILAAAPKAAPRPPTGPDGGTALGSDTNLRDDGGAPDPSASASAGRAPTVRVGKPVTEPDVSNGAVEQAARAQLYWVLTQRCRAEDGALLPPEAVHVMFQIDADGYLVPQSILAQPKEDRFAAAARCMARALSTVSFRGPPSARGRPHAVSTDVPSVD